MTSRSKRRRYARDEQHSRKQIPAPSPSLMGTWLLVNRLQRYWLDLAAWPILALALLTFLGLFDNLSHGSLINVWGHVLGQWLGWGKFLVPIALAWLGVALVRHNFGRTMKLRWARIIAGEVAGVALLGLLDRLDGGTLTHIMAGGGGGIVGWGVDQVAAALAVPAWAEVLALGLVFVASFCAACPPISDRLARWWADLQVFGPSPDVGGSGTPASDAAGASGQAGPAGGERAAPASARPKSRLAPGERLRVPVDSSSAVITRTKAPKRDKRLPSLELLDNSDLRRPVQKDIDETASIIVKTLKEFGVPVTVVGAKVGPSVTQYQVEPGFVEKPGPDGASKQWKVRVSQISSLADDLALTLSANTLRIEAPVPGQSYVGIEVPNRRASLVSLRPVMESDAFQRLNAPLALALGRDVSGTAVVADLGKMPHLLIAGTTGSGKSVCITSLVTCLAANNTPDDLRLILIDPKMVELVRFNGLPHLYGKVETELDRILGVLRWVTREMDNRYKLFEAAAARNLDNYNSKMARRKDGERLPRIVLMVDELADLMMQVPDETERTLVRLAQMARATGIHLVVATQRPSTDIVTGLIKANFPARISFAVASGIDSRVILDTPGAESLLGKGDMLFLSPEVGAPARLQGCFVTDKEVDRIVCYWREQMQDEASEDDLLAEETGEPDTPAEKAAPAADRRAAAPGAVHAPWDEMLAREAVVEDKDRQIEQAIEIVKKYGTASASLLQRKMRIGYPRAARLMDELKSMGIVGRERTGGKTREVFIEEDDDPIGERAARIIGRDDDDEE
jgi:S-DNA-T family DNA segregation ATPase FtsK/SpoIIIE